MNKNRPVLQNWGLLLNMFNIEKLIDFEERINTDIALCKQAFFEGLDDKFSHNNFRCMTDLINYYEKMSFAKDDNLEDDLSCYLDDVDLNDDDNLCNQVDNAEPTYLDLTELVSVDFDKDIDVTKIINQEVVIDETVYQNLVI